MQKIFVTLILFSLLLAGCGTFEVYVESTPVEDFVLPRAIAATATTEPGLSMNSASEEIRLAMLESASKWKSIWMDGTITYYAMPGSDSRTGTTHEQVWIDLPTGRFRVLMGPVEGQAEKYMASDGVSILEMDLASGQSQSHPLPDFAKAGQFVPTPEPGTAYPQPLWGQMGTPLSQLAFSSDFAQSDGTFKPITTDLIAGREALVVDWTFSGNQLPSWRMWLDTDTAVLLKMQTYDKEGGNTIRSEALVNQISFEDVFADSLFGNPSSLPQFSNSAGVPLKPGQPAPTASSDPDPLGEVYFFVFDHNYGNEKTQLVRVPGSCAAGLLPCPEAEVISTPFNLNFSLTPLVWSPTREEAAFVSAGGREKNALFIFNPKEQTWTSLVEFNFIDPPLWSPDGEWLAFRVQDGEGKDEIYAIRRDGTGLKNVSINENLPNAGQPYVLNGWISNNIILRARNDMVYLLRVNDGKVKPLFDTPWAKSDFVSSPDGYFLAYNDVSDTRAVLKLLTPNGKTTRELASFEQSSLYPLVWSPDGKELAFAKLSNDPAGGQDVYTINLNGQNLQQVYHSTSSGITNLSFSPDGKYLLFQDDDATGRHIFVIDLSTMEKHMLMIPKLPLDWWWIAPSWQR